MDREIFEVLLDRLTERDETVARWRRLVDTLSAENEQLRVQLDTAKGPAQADYCRELIVAALIGRKLDMIKGVRLLTGMDMSEGTALVEKAVARTWQIARGGA